MVRQPFSKAFGSRSFGLPGRAPSRRYALTVGEDRDLEVVMKDEAELAGAGLIAGDELPPSGPEEVRPST